MNIRNNSFTLIELLLYVAILSILVTGLIPFGWYVIQGGVKNRIVQEVSSNARFIENTLSNTIRNSSGINSVSLSSISLSQTAVSDNPTVFTCSGNAITIQKGSAGAVNLHGDSVQVYDCVFTNYSSADTKTKHIGYEFKIRSHGGSRQEYLYNTSVRSSAEIRSN